MRLLIDCSSIIWTCLMAGKDVDGVQVSHNGRNFQVNTAMYGYENAINSITKAMSDTQTVPANLILVFEGRDSKKRRCMLEPQYKANRDGNRPPEAYIEFHKCRDMLRQTFRDLGAIAVQQDFVEGDDVLAWLALNSADDVTVMTNDGDLTVLNGVNARGSICMVRRNGVIGENPYGSFNFQLITLYKATVGDTSDNIKGAQGFGAKAFEAVLARYGEDGCFELAQLISEGNRDALSEIAVDNKCKYLERIVENWDSVVRSYRLAQLHPEWVNTVRSQLDWAPGMPKATVGHELLRSWRAQYRLVTAENYDQALKFLKSKVAESPDFSIDFETTTPVESDDWLEERGRGGGIDVMGSTLVSCGITFGRNRQYGFYVSVDHADTKNVSKQQLAEMLMALPADKFNIAHNAGGFELVVAYNELKDFFGDNGWRGFIPNMIDTRIAASYWDENQPSHGLKQLTQLLLDYTQTTYDEVTTKEGPEGSLTGGKVLRSFRKEVTPTTYKKIPKVDDEGYPTDELVEVIDVLGTTEDWEARQYKMHELTAAETVAYGLDDVFTAASLWNFFSLIMELEQTLDQFIADEQKPLYLSALSYVQGIPLDIPRLKVLEKADAETSTKCWETIESFLIEKEWEGVKTPVFTDLSPANVKQAVKVILGMELQTMVRTQSKLAILVGELEHEDAEMLSKFIADDRVDLVNSLIAKRYTGKPEFNVGSPKQIAHLLYDVIGMPMRMRNKVTDAMRAKGLKEGNPRTDDGAIEMAIKLGDVDGKEKAVLEALLESKSCNTRNALYWKAYPTFLHWKTGRIHPELRQSSTNTRRWTASSPNVQQQEANPDGVRSIILADADHVIVSLDESSQEVRQLAEFANDEALNACYIGTSLRDTHSIVGCRVAQMSYEEFMAARKAEDTKDWAAAIRQKAKIVLFSVIYGATAPKVAETLGITEAEAQKYIDTIFEEFPGIKRYKDESEKLAQQYGYVSMQNGTRRHLAKLIMSEDKWEASKALRQAGNARIQGSGAGQLKRVMARIWDSRLIEDFRYRWVFPVHDETVHMIHKDTAAPAIKILHGFMTEPYLKTIPSESSIGIGRNFGQLIELPEKEFQGGKYSNDLVVAAVEKLFA